ncbi:MAG: TonB-dependent receptor, partial [Gemmatimonadota bacterium]
PADAQTGRLTGIVTDAQTGEPLSGVQVFLDGTGIGTLTAENGRYFLLNIQPGTYTVGASLIGYAEVRRENVLVAIDIARRVNFEMQTQAVGLAEIIVEADRVPLIETRATGTKDIISLEEIQNLPISTINEALALRSGFLDVPANTEVLSQAEEERGLNPVRIRGGRGGETLTLIDNVPMNNFVFGGAAFQPNPYVTEQIDFIRGGIEPQYGNALSGILNISLREGGTTLEGTLDYQTSELAGALGSNSDDLWGRHLFQGFISGPVPGTQNKVRFMVSGRESRRANRVLDFDDEVFNPLFTQPELGDIQPNRRDLLTGERSFGFNHSRDIFGKLTFLVTPTAKLNLTAIDFQNQSQNFFFSLLLSAQDPVSACVETNDDFELCEAQFDGSTQPGGAFADITQGSIDADGELLIAEWSHSLGSAAFYTLTGSRLKQGREVCNFFQGVCLEDRFANTNFSESFEAPGVNDIFPASGTGRAFGGERIETWMGRGDVEAQVSDHHNVRGGLFYQTHDIAFREARDIGISGVELEVLEYGASPWEAAFYLQDRIEYDFINIDLGFRFDTGEAGGLFFDNPLDPTNGTTAFTVCDNPGDWQNVTTFEFNEDLAKVDTLTGISADPQWTRQFCAENRDALSEAALIATSDDFSETRSRSQFSPRIGINFPITESSTAFFNFGRLSQNPLYNNVFQQTGIGTTSEGTSDGPSVQPIGRNNPFLGNSNLLIEETTSYEIGFLSQIADMYALSAILYTKDQTGLTGVVTGGVDAQGNQVFDPGVTFGTNTPSYTVLVNQDFATVRGLELSLRKRLQDYWSFSINYAFSRAKTNAAPPERQAERIIENLSESFREITSGVDQPHNFNGTFTVAVGDDAPAEGILGEIIRNANASFIVRANSGLPFTPQDDNFLSAFSSVAPDAINSERGPSNFSVDLQAQKAFHLNNVRYSFYGQVTNVFDRVNCLQVSPQTGECDEGGFNFTNRRVGNGASSSTTLDRPQRIGNRRQIRTGVRVIF